MTTDPASHELGEPPVAPGAEAPPDATDLQLEQPEPTAFGRKLLPVGVVALAVRLVYAIGWRFSTGLQYDGPVYLARAQFLRQGNAFLSTDDWIFQQHVSQGAIHPPGNTVLIAFAHQVGLRSIHQTQLFGCLVGTVTVLVIAHLGREVAGRRVGLIAAWIAAVHPGLWSFDPTAMAETPGQLLTAVLLLLVYRFWRSPSLVGAAWLGGVAAAAAMTRSELLILVAILVIPICFIAPGTNRQALQRVGAAVLWAAMVLGPWVGWNLVRFEHPVTLASGIDLSLAYAQCDDTWYGPNTGYWNLFCATDVPKRPGNEFADESELGRQYRKQAGAYIADHRGRWPVVLAARAGRTLSTYPPRQQITVEHERESREVLVLWAATLATWLSYLAAAVAFVRPPRTRRHLLPLLTPLAAGVAGAVITFGTSRYRSAGEVGLIILASVGVDAMVRTWNARPTRGSNGPVPPEPDLTRQPVDLGLDHVDTHPG